MSSLSVSQFRTFNFPLPYSYHKTYFAIYYPICAQFNAMPFDSFLQEELSKNFFEKTLPTKLVNFQKRLEANNGGKGFFAGEKVILTTAVYHGFVRQQRNLSSKYCQILIAWFATSSLGPFLFFSR